MVSIWETICWIIIGFLVGYVVADPGKRKYFN